MPQSLDQREVLAYPLQLRLVVLNLGRQALDCDISRCQCVLCKIYGSEAALAKLAHELVLVDASEDGSAAGSHRHRVVYGFVSHFYSC